MRRLTFIVYSGVEIEAGNIPVALILVEDDIEGNAVELKNIIITSISEASLLRLLREETIHHGGIVDDENLKSELYAVYNINYLKLFGYKPMDFDEFVSYLSLR